MGGQGSNCRVSDLAAAENDCSTPDHRDRHGLLHKHDGRANGRTDSWDNRDRELCG